MFPHPPLRSLPLLAALLSVAPAFAEDSLVLTGPRAVVRSRVPHRPAAERCLEALESAVPLYERHLPARLPEGQKLVLHLLASRAEYLETVRRLGAEVFSDNLAFTSVDTRESYVVLQPRAEPEYLDLVGDLPELTRHLVLHEGAHQWLYRSDSPNARWWPAWYAEGMAEHVAEQAAGPAGEASFLRDDADHAVLDGIRTGRLLNVDRLLHADPATFQRRSALYAQCRSFYRFLAADPVKLAVLHDAVRSLGEPPAPRDGAVDRRGGKFASPCAWALVQAYGPSEGLERAWREAASKATPRWLEPIRSAQRVGETIVCAAFPESNAMLVAAAPPPGGPLAIEGEFLLTGIGRREAKVYVAFEQRDDPRFVKLDLGIEGFFCTLTILPYADGFWQPRYRNAARLPADAFPVREWVPFRVTADERSVRVTAGGTSNVMNAIAPPGYDSVRGGWGIGAYDGVVKFRGLRLNGLPVDTSAAAPSK